MLGIQEEPWAQILHRCLNLTDEWELFLSIRPGLLPVISFLNISDPGRKMFEITNNGVPLSDHQPPGKWREQRKSGQWWGEEAKGKGVDDKTNVSY